MPLHPILTTILDHKREEVRHAKALVSESALLEKALGLDKRRSFRAAISDAGKPVRIIAEIKRSSPTKMFKPVGFDPVEIAKGYEKAGAVALSVLTDARFFSGHPLYVPMVREEVAIPVLRKEFIIDRWQVAETAALGADSVLLMALCLNDDQLSEYYEMALGLGLEPLVEIHSEDEWERVTKLDPKLVGINNRDFLSENLDVDIDTTARLAPLMPDDVTVISESGISASEDLQRLAKAGADGFLIGSALMKEEDPASALTRFY